MTEEKQTKEINLKTLLQTCVKLWWVILILCVLGGFLGGIITFATTNQTYQATTMLYVNNSSSLASTISDIKSSLSINDINAAKSICDAYSVIIKTRSALTEVSTRLNNLETYYPEIKYTPVEFGHKTFNQANGFKYDYDYLIKLISVGSVDDTEILQIKIVSTSQAEAILVANVIADVAINKISSIINGTSVKIVDPATIATPISRGFGKNIAIGLLVGLVAAFIIVLIVYFVDDVIKSEDDIKDAFNESIPVLSVIPDSNEVIKHKYYKNSKYGYEYGDYYAKDKEKKD